MGLIGMSCVKTRKTHNCSAFFFFFFVKQGAGFVFLVLLLI